MFKVHVLITLALLAFCQGKHRSKRDIMFPGYNEPPNFYQPHQQHHHHHHTTPRRPLYHGTTPSPRDTSLPRAIPDDLLDLLNEVSSIEDYIKNVRNNNASLLGDVSLLGNRIGMDDIEKKSALNPKFAKCMPEEQTVTVEIEDPNPSYMYMPLCIRVKRCGGCCTNSIHVCRPTATDLISYKVMGSQYRGHGNTLRDMELKEVKIVTVEEHRACKCGCKINALNCTQGIQTFSSSTCSCVCSNKDDQRKCQNQDLMQWDSKRCACVCKNIRECSTGSIFSPRTCRCEADRKRNSESRRRRGDESSTQTRSALN